MRELSSRLAISQDDAGKNYQAVRTELLDLLYAYLPAVLAANLVNGILIALIFDGVVARPIVIAWCTLLLVMVAVRGVLWALYRRARPDAERIQRWGWLAVIGSATSGVLWGTAGVLFSVPGSPFHYLVLAFVLGGMGAGAMAGLAAHLPAFYAYLVLSILPFGIRLAAEGGAEHLALSGMVLMYTIGMGTLGRQHHASPAFRRPWCVRLGATMVYA